MSGLLKGSDRYAGPRPLHYPVVGDLLFCFGLTQCDIALNLDTVPIRQGQPGQPDQKTRRGHRGATARETLTRPWRQLLAAEAGNADYLVTGDKSGLLLLASHKSTRIMTARVCASATQPHR